MNHTLTKGFISRGENSCSWFHLHDSYLKFSFFENCLSNSLFACLLAVSLLCSGVGVLPSACFSFSLCIYYIYSL